MSSKFLELLVPLNPRFLSPLADDHLLPLGPSLLKIVRHDFPASSVDHLLFLPDLCGPGLALLEGLEHRVGHPGFILFLANSGVLLSSELLPEGLLLGLLEALLEVGRIAVDLTDLFKLLGQPHRSLELIPALELEAVNPPIELLDIVPDPPGARVLPLQQGVLQAIHICDHNIKSEHC